MHPILIDLGFVRISSYGFFFASGVLLAIILASHLAKRAGLDLRLFGDFLFFTVISSIVGSRVMLVLTDFKYYVTFPGAWKSLLTSGGVYYGGLLAGGAFALWFIRRHRLDLTVVADLLAPAIALGHALGRIGCSMAGCCWGRAAEGCPLHITMTNLQAHELTGVPLFIPLIPVQLIEATLNLLLCGALLLILWKRRYPGQVFFYYLMAYAVIRFALEYLRGDAVRGYLLGDPSHPFSSLTLAQGISLLSLLLAGVWRMIALKRAHAQRAL